MSKQKKKNNKKEKNGLMIGFITDGMVPIEWMIRLNKIASGIPSGMFWKYVWYKGKGYKDKGGYAKARTKVIEQARANNAKWLLFLDTDVLAPPDVVTRLMSHNKPLVTGIYYMKSQPSQPVIFQKMGNGPYWDFPVNELFEIEGSGLGCTLIDMDVFDKFEEEDLPFFKENWTYTKKDGSKVRVKVGEDHWFFMKSKELGYQPYCDSSILCDHMDTNTGAIFPGEKEVKRIRNKILKKEGRDDIIEKENKLYNVDKDKKTIVFYNATNAEFAGDELERRGVGGSEGDIINLAKIFAKYYNVLVFCNCPRPGVYDGVKYMHVRDTEYLKEVDTDLLIVSRNTQLLANVDFKEKFNVDKVCLWTHDLPDSYVFDKLPKAIPNIDRIFALTEWHKDAIKERFKDVPSDMWFYARNGVETDLFKQEVERDPYRLIYSSTPFRGLDVLLKVFPKIKEKVPKANLHIFSSMKVYGSDGEEKDKDYKKLYDLAKELDGVHYHGSVKRKRLAKEMKKASLLAYPNKYKETCCITAMEAMTAGTPIVTTKLAALPEIIPDDCGILIDGDSNSEDYQKKFIDSVVELLNNKEKWNKMHKECLKQDFSWLDISKEWINEFFPEDLEEFSKAINKQETKQEPKKESKENINTPKYWDKQYKYEEESNIDQRSDIRRWNLIEEKIPKNSVILDFGCGRGKFLEYLKDDRPDCKLYGIDFSEYALKCVAKRVPDARLTSKIDNLPYDLKENYFDVITAQHVMEHLSEPKKLIKDLKKILAKDGLLIIAIPIDDDPWPEHMKIWTIEDFIELLNNFNCIYSIKQREMFRKKKDGSPKKEAIAFIRFDGGEK